MLITYCVYTLMSMLLSKKLDEATAQLKLTSMALQQEKQKTDMLLYQMLPVKVANSLKEGKQVSAGMAQFCITCTCTYEYHLYYRYAPAL